MKRLFILADDLTGAADSAARCRAVGLPARIALDVLRPPLMSGASALSTDSRHLAPAQAFRRVREGAGPLRGEKGRWYKKIDSTLRGNLGAEIDALMQLVESPAAFVCPAFPDQDRGLENGHLVAPNLPPVQRHLPTLLREQSRHPVRFLALSTIRSGELIEGIREESRRASYPIFVCDGMTNEDLELILMAVDQNFPNALLCGSAGLVGPLARRIAGPSAARASEPVRRQPSTQLIVVGSGSPTAHAQIGALVQRSENLAVRVVDPTPGAERSTPFSFDAERWLICQPEPAPGARLEGDSARARAGYLGELAAEAVARRFPDRIILVGGDTAMAVLSRLGVTMLEVEAELMPGIPLCSGVDEHNRRLEVILKPGNFGSERTLVDLVNG